MKKKLKKIATASLCFMIMSTAHAYKIIIYTDEKNPTKAKEVSEMMKTIYPFSKLDIEVEIAQLQPEELVCESMYGIDRLVGCSNSDVIQQKVMMAGGDQGMIIKDIPKYGGSAQVGGGIPVITTQASYTAMLHEYMHTLGLCDEYEYAESEAEIYCNDESNSNPNLIFINPLEPYASDEAARSNHMGQIPWFDDILEDTKITNSEGSRLGTGFVDFNKTTPVNRTNKAENPNDRTGLYRGKVCNKAKPIKASWHPGAGSTIMENTSAGLGLPLEKIVEKIMISKGAKYKVAFSGPIEPPSEDIVDAQLKTNIFNSTKIKIRRIDSGTTKQIIKSSETLAK